MPIFPPRSRNTPSPPLTEREVEHSLNETHAYLEQAWILWKNETAPGEERGIAVDRMRECLSKGFSELNLQHLSLTSLPALPHDILSLDCSYNQLISLPSLPTTLISISCDNNKLKELPILPRNLQYLSCNSNVISQLPELPDSIETLDCCKNQLLQLPNLPEKLCDLLCKKNQLTFLPALPRSLQSLCCYDNRIATLPYLPENLKALLCARCDLTYLPELPETLEKLYCFNNKLRTLPALPDTLQILHCNNNQLTQLPALPNNLQKLICSNNKIVWLPLLPSLIASNPTPPSLVKDAITRLISLHDYSQAEIALPILSSWGVEDATSWFHCLGEEVEDVHHLMYFLSTLSNISGLKRTLQQTISDWLKLLPLEKNKELRRTTYFIAYEATTTCSDKRVLSLCNMLLADTSAQIIHEINEGRYENIHQRGLLIEQARQAYRTDKLFQIADKHIMNAKRRNIPVDEVEIYLGFQFKLRQELNLFSFFSTMKFVTLAVNDEELEKAKQEVLEKEQSDFIPFLATQWSPWEEYLKTYHAEAHERARNRWLDLASDPNLLNPEIDIYIKSKSLPENDEDVRIQVGKIVIEEVKLKVMLSLTQSLI